MSKATAQNASQSFADFLIGSFRLSVQYSFGSQDHATQAKSALSGTFVNESLLNWVRFFWCAKALKRCNLILANSAHRHHAGSDYLAPQDHRTGPALGHPASELGTSQPDLITQSEEQRRFRFQFYGVQLAIHFEGNLIHSNLLAHLRFNSNLILFCL
jgi:hypothetical protein